MRRSGLVAVFLGAVAAAAAACDREERQLNEVPESPTRYDDNAYAMSQGKRLFSFMNCAGCHSQGGGGMGPPLMDDRWIYGSTPTDIFRTIVDGRPNGMPSFKHRLTEQQVWQLVAYVRTLGSLTEHMARSARDDHMKVAPNQIQRPRLRPTDITQRREPR
jgi:cytochrome c oxidase cbb3-type subunit 3